MRLIQKLVAGLSFLAMGSGVAHAAAWTVGSATGAAGTNVTVPVNFAGDGVTITSQVTVNVAAPLSVVSATGQNGQSCSATGNSVTVVAFSFSALPAGPTNFCDIVIAIAPGAAAGGYPVTPSGQLCSVSGGGAAPACTAAAGTVTVPGGPVNTPPVIAYNPATGSTITYTAGGTAAPIVATPSGGSGSGAAATTTVGACTITGGGAAFPTTTIAQLSFVGNTTTAQNINLPSCVPQAAATTATLTCPETPGAGASVNRVWTLTCPAAPPANTPPTIAYNPLTGATIAYTAGGTAAPIVATPSGGSGSGAAATTTVGACNITGGGAAFPTTTIAQLSFVGNTTTAQNINLPSCVPQAAITTATLTCPETRGAAAAVNRVWTLTCPAAPVGNVPPTIAYNPLTGTTIAYTAGGTAAPIVATPSGGSGSGAAATTTVGACNITGGGAAFPTTTIAQLSFVGNTTTAQNINLPSCVPQAAITTATLTCPETPGAGAAVNRVWTLTCPAAPVGNTAPTIAYNPLTGTTISYTAGGTAAPIVATPSGGSGSGAAATTTVGACNITGGGAAFPTTTIAQLSFVGSTTTAQNINLPNCVPQAAPSTATLTCPETQGGAAAMNRTWTLVCPAGAPVGPTLAYNPTAGASAGSGGPVNFTGTGNVGTPRNGVIVVTPSGGANAGTSTVNNCSFSGGTPSAFAGAAGVNLTFTAGNNTAQNINLTCTTTAAAQTTNLQCTETINGGATSTRFFVLNCPAGTVAPVGPNVASSPASGASAGTGGPVNLTGTTVVGSQGTGSITFTPSGGAGGGTTTIGNCAYSGPGSANFGGATGTLTFTAGTATPQSLALTCTAGPTATTANLQCTQTISGGATSTLFFVVNCPAGTVVAALPVPVLSEHLRLLLAALMVLIGMTAVAMRSRD